MWNLLNLCTDKLYMLVSYLQDIASVALSFITDCQRKQKDKKFSIYRFLSIPDKNINTDDVDPLFPSVTSSSLQTLTPQGPLVHQCAVSEFNFDYSAPTPINWSDNNSKNTRDTNKNNVSSTNNNNNSNNKNNNSNNYNNNNTQQEYHSFDPDVLLSQFNASFNYQLAQTNVVDVPLDNHFGNTNYSLPLLESNQFKTSHNIPLSPLLSTDRLDSYTDDDVPPLDDELFFSFFADRPTKRERQDTLPATVDLDTDGEIDSDTKIEQKITTPCKIRKTGIISTTDAPYVCEFCDVRFKVKGYLTRHVKKHYASKPFRCPYFDSTKTISKERDNNKVDDEKDCNENDDCDTSRNDDNDSSILNESVSRCHITGGFSRRDTLNTHLKALHFIYPSGTKSIDRDRKSGHCGACFKEFSNNKEWLTQHIMTNSCLNIITKYK